MANRKTGPVTLPGKKISSRNALKHGATSPSLINDEEQERYETLIDDLSKEYASKNPLIGLQIERIARIAIQLERIQNVIDATFKRSRAQSNIHQNLMNSLKMDEDQRISVLTSKLFSTEDTQKTQKQDQILLELISIKLDKPTSTEDFVARAPALCDELQALAKHRKLSIKLMIERIAPDPNTPKKVVVITGVPNERVGDPDYRVTEESILDVDLYSLMKAARWKQNEIQRSEMSKKKLTDYETLLPIEEQATTPDLDQLDKLMRYQTTLQRQLSTTIGELMALTKNIL